MIKSMVGRWIPPAEFLLRRQGGYAKTGDPVRWPKGFHPHGATSTDLRLGKVC